VFQNDIEKLIAMIIQRLSLFYYILQMSETLSFEELVAKIQAIEPDFKPSANATVQSLTKKLSKISPKSSETETNSDLVLMINVSGRNVNGVRPNASVEVDPSEVDSYKVYGFVVSGEVPVVEESTDTVVAPTGPTKEEMQAKLIDWGFAEDEIAGMELEALNELYAEQLKQNEPEIITE
jgi:hypothetical protein